MQLVLTDQPHTRLGQSYFSNLFYIASPLNSLCRFVIGWSSSLLRCLAATYVNSVTVHHLQCSDSAFFPVVPMLTWHDRGSDTEYGSDLTDSNQTWLPLFPPSLSQSVSLSLPPHLRLVPPERRDDAVRNKKIRICFFQHAHPWIVTGV